MPAFEVGTIQHIAVKIPAPMHRAQQQGCTREGSRTTAGAHVSSWHSPTWHRRLLHLAAAGMGYALPADLRRRTALAARAGGSVRQAAKWHQWYVQGREFGQLEKLVLIQFRNVVVVKPPAAQRRPTLISNRDKTRTRDRLCMFTTVHQQPSTIAPNPPHGWQGNMTPTPAHRRKRVHPRGQPPTDAQHPSPPQSQEGRGACVAAFKVTYKFWRLVSLSKRVAASSVMALL